jgi:hypothetical protein
MTHSLHLIGFFTKQWLLQQHRCQRQRNSQPNSTSQWMRLNATPVFSETSTATSRTSSDQAGLTLAFGSKFCPIEQLRPILQQHPGFAELAKVLVTGTPCRCSRETTKTEREQEALAACLRKVTTSQPKTSPRLWKGHCQGRGPWIFNGDSDRAGSSNAQCLCSACWTG